MNRQVLATYGLKWDPFSTGIPADAIHVTARLGHFCWRVEQMLPEGGFAKIQGDPGTGKSVALRFLADRLGKLRDVVVGVVTHPQCSLADMYRQLGDLFEVTLTTSNRWGGFKTLRNKWVQHFDSSRFRPVLLIDEAQLVLTNVLEELRVLSSLEFDSKNALTVVLVGDQRLTDRFLQPELVPLGTRIRVRLEQKALSPKELQEFLENSLELAGNSHLMTPPLVRALAEHAHGNLRVLMNLASEVFTYGAKQEVSQLDEGLFLELFTPEHERGKPPRKKQKGGAP